MAVVDESYEEKYQGVQYKYVFLIFVQTLKEFCCMEEVYYCSVHMCRRKRLYRWSRV